MLNFSPLFSKDLTSQSVYLPFAPLSLSSVPILYVLAQAAVFSMANALWAMSQLISAYIPNRFVTLTDLNPKTKPMEKLVTI